MVKNLPPSVREQCIESQIVIRNCKEKKYGENCAELIKQCVTITGAPPVTIGGSGQYRVASSLRDCIKKGGYMGYCKTFTTEENCIEWKDECAPSEAAEKKDENSLEVFPETFSQCFKSQVVMQQCMSKGEEECSKIQKECVDAFGTPPVTYAANGAYQMAAPLHRCIENGGWMKMCSTWINATICERWKQECSGDKDAELPPNFSQCIQTQMVMLQCNLKFGDKCKALQDECVAATDAPTVDANPPIFTSKMNTCVKRKMAKGL
uniref:Ani s 12 allergen n=1 Tax=Anisakis pegreffii TaxID=303229 RepID=L7V0J5_9BILA|nr:Ani s 12 allergen [Anisakis pegreffii]